MVVAAQPPSASPWRAAGSRPTPRYWRATARTKCRAAATTRSSRTRAGPAPSARASFPPAAASPSRYSSARRPPSGEYTYPYPPTFFTYTYTSKNEKMPPLILFTRKRHLAGFLFLSFPFYFALLFSLSSSHSTEKEASVGEKRREGFLWRL